MPETLIDEQPIMKNALSCWIAGVVLASVSGCAPLSQIPAAPRVREGSFSIPASPPPANYDTAKIALKKLFASAPQTLSQAGRPRAFLHDQPTEDVFVLLQGLTNAPEQFDKLGRILFERGHNVVLPLTPGHGEADLMTDKLGAFTAQAMLDSANEAVTLAHGLGRRVTVVGLSINGTTAAWIAQNRADADRVVLLAPFIAPFGLPQWALSPLGNLIVRLPNAFFWWDPTKKDKLARPPYVYARFSTRSIGETMLLGLDVLRASRRSAPACGSILVVTSASDFAANNTLTARLAANWQERRPGAVATYQFPKKDDVPHDFIDPNQPNQRVELVYPRLIEMLETGMPSARVRSCCGFLGTTFRRLAGAGSRKAFGVHFRAAGFSPTPALRFQASGFAEQNSGSLRAGFRKSVAYFESQYRRKFLIVNIKSAPGFEPRTY